MSEILTRDDLLITVNRLMICAMEDIDCGRDEAGPTTLDLVERIERHDAALRAENERLAEALREIASACECGFPRCQSNVARAALAEHRDANGKEAGS